MTILAFMFNQKHSAIISDLSPEILERNEKRRGKIRKKNFDDNYYFGNILTLKSRFDREFLKKNRKI